MTLEGHYVSEVVEGCSNWRSDEGLGCDGMRSNGSSRVQSGPIHGTKLVGEVLRGVGEVMLMGPKYR